MTKQKNTVAKVTEQETSTNNKVVSTSKKSNRQGSRKTNKNNCNGCKNPNCTCTNALTDQDKKDLATLNATEILELGSNDTIKITISTSPIDPWYKRLYNWIKSWKIFNKKQK